MFVSVYFLALSRRWRRGGARCVSASVLQAASPPALFRVVPDALCCSHINRTKRLVTPRIHATVKSLGRQLQRSRAVFHTKFAEGVPAGASMASGSRPASRETTAKSQPWHFHREWSRSEAVQDPSRSVTRLPDDHNTLCCAHKFAGLAVWTH